MDLAYLISLDSPSGRLNGSKPSARNVPRHVHSLTWAWNQTVSFIQIESRV